MLTGLNVISGSHISNLTGWKFTSFLRFHFLSMPLFSLWQKIYCFTCSTHVKKRLAAKSDKNIIIEGERSIKAAKKDYSATVVVSIRSTGATVVGSVNVTEL